MPGGQGARARGGLGARQAGCPGARTRLVAASGARGPLTRSSPHLVPSSTGSYPEPLSRTSAWQGAESVVMEQEPRSRGFWPPSQSRTPHVWTLRTEGPLCALQAAVLGGRGGGRRRGPRPWGEPSAPRGREPVVPEGGAAETLVRPRAPVRRGPFWAAPTGRPVPWSPGVGPGRDSPVGATGCPGPAVCGDAVRVALVHGGPRACRPEAVRTPVWGPRPPQAHLPPAPASPGPHRSRHLWASVGQVPA